MTNSTHDHLQKPRRLARVTSLFVALLFAFATAGPAWAAAPATNVRVGFFAFEGYHMVNEYGERSGYGYDYLQNLARYSNLSFEYVGYEKTWMEMKDMLEEGSIDLLTSAQKTPERMERFDFSDRPIGTSAAMLTVKAGNTRYINRDYGKLDGIRVGLLEGNSRNVSLQKFAAENGFSYTPLFYKSNQTLLTALQNGDVDAVLTSNLRKTKNEWVVATFDSSPYYIMVQKGNKTLLSLVNQAIGLLDLYQPNLQTSLYDRYYSASTGDEIAYTAAERAYIRSRAANREKLKVLMNPDRIPLSYFENGEAKGILPDILAKIMARSGLPYEIVPSTSREAYERNLLAGGGEVCFDSRYDFNKAEREGFILTEPYLKATVSYLTRKGGSQAPQTIAALNQSDITEEYVLRNYAADCIRTYPTVEACVNAVLAGEADAVYLYTYTAQRYLYQDDLNRLQETLIPDFTVSFSMAVDIQEDPLLFSILNKAVLSLGEEEANRIVRERTTYPVRQATVRGYLYSHPLARAAIWLAGFLLLGGVIFLFFKRKSSRLEREKNKEFERFITYVCRANDYVLEYDLARKAAMFYQIVDGHVLQRDWALEGDLFERVHPEDRAGMEGRLQREKLLQMAQTGGELYFECRTLLQEGYVWCAYTVQGMPGTPNQPGQILIFIKNIQQAKLEEANKRQALEDALAAAHQAGQTKSAFLSRMSHEIRTPLNAIIGYLHILERSLDDPEKVRACLEKQEYAAQHLLAIVNDILDISSIESGRMKLAHEAFDLRELLSETVAIFGPQAKQKGVAFQMHAGGTFRVVLGDRLRVNQILMNLLSNAIKFTGPGGSVGLTVEQKAVIGGRVHLQFEVSDTGIGMREDFLQRIFTPFEQQEAGTAHRFGGTGLGLSITKNLVTMMDGTIGVASKAGEGTRFTVGLSFETAQPPELGGQQPEQACPAPVPAFHGCRVMLAEDNEMNREIAQDILESAGVEVAGVVNGLEAVEAFLQSAPQYFQLILMDIQMPVMDGYEAARQIRASGHPQAKEIPIIACSADAFTEDVNKALAAGMDGHIAKPIDANKLYELLGQFLQSGRPSN